MRVLFVASPLHARSGVYRSARETVVEARRLGLPWSLLLGVDRSAPGSPPADDPPWIIEEQVDQRGPAGLLSQRRWLMEAGRDADLVVSMLPQTDMAISLTRTPWVAYVRGLPWPAPGEASTPRRLAWRALERAALSKARQVWVTTPTLLRDTNLRRSVAVVPAGIAPVQRTYDGEADRRTAVWAARFDRDKNPQLFLDVMRGVDLSGVMHGSGPLMRRISQAAPAQVRVAGWSRPERLWENSLAYVGTSTREAFGRSAVEAAMSGVPVLLSNAFGCADLLYQDAALRRLFVLDARDPQPWRATLRRLAFDRGLRREASDHLSTNARHLTINGSVQKLSGVLDARDAAPTTTAGGYGRPASRGLR